jgi:hypothetical protein
MLQEKLVSTQGGDGMLSKSQLYTEGVNETAQLLQAKPWLELVETGTFSPATLNRLPTSFMVSPGWVRLLHASARNFTSAGAVGPRAWNTTGSETSKRTAAPTNIPAGSWLHLFHLGVAYAETGDADAARAHHLASHALQPSPTNSRNLALMADVSHHLIIPHIPISTVGRCEPHTFSFNIQSLLQAIRLPVAHTFFSLCSAIVGELFLFLLEIAAICLHISAFSSSARWCSV